MIYLGIETSTWFDDPKIQALSFNEQIYAMRFGLATTFNDDNGEWRTWYAQELMELWRYFQTTNYGVGWNLNDFDICIIKCEAGRLFRRMPLIYTAYYDISFEIRNRTGRNYKLDTIAQANLGRGQSANEEQVAKWLNSGEPELIHQAAEYSHNNIELIYELYQILLQDKPLLLPAQLERNEIGDLEFYGGWK